MLCMNALSGSTLGGGSLAVINRGVGLPEDYEPDPRYVAGFC